MPTQELTLVVICGLPTAGKTTLTNALKLDFLSRDGYEFVSLDEVREEAWGSKRKLTDAEHLYKNRIAEREVQNAFIVRGAICVFYDAVMLTRERHQKPLMEMVRDTEDWLSKIQEEVGSPVDVKIRVKCIWLTCPRKIIEQRMGERWSDPLGAHSVNMDAWDDLQGRFKNIVEFPYRQFDTSIISLSDLVQKAIKYIEE